MVIVYYYIFEGALNRRIAYKYSELLNKHVFSSKLLSEHPPDEGNLQPENNQKNPDVMDHVHKDPTFAGNPARAQAEQRMAHASNSFEPIFQSGMSQEEQIQLFIIEEEHNFDSLKPCH